jgi:hypothetical protein
MKAPLPAGYRSVPLGWSGPLPPGYEMVSRWIGESEVPLWLSRHGNTIPPEVGAGGRLSVTDYEGGRVSGTGPIRLDFAFPSRGFQRGGVGRFIIQPAVNTPIYNVTFHIPPALDFERLKGRV